MNTMTSSRNRIRTTLMAALFCAIAFLCTFVFHVRVSFLTLDIKDAVMAVFGMFFGPLPALAVVLVTALVEFMTIGTTGWYGLVMDILSSGAFILPITCIYYYKKTLPTAFLGLAGSIAFSTVVMLFANYFITPFYMGVPRTAVVELFPTLLFPFNLTKAALNAGMVLILYKPISVALKHAGFHRGEAQTAFRFQGKTLLVMLLGLLLVVATVLYFVLGMDAVLSFFSSVG